MLPSFFAKLINYNRTPLPPPNNNNLDFFLSDPISQSSLLQAWLTLSVAFFCDFESFAECWTQASNHSICLYPRLTSATSLTCPLALVQRMPVVIFKRFLDDKRNRFWAVRWATLHSEHLCKISSAVGFARPIVWCVICVTTVNLRRLRRDLRFAAGFTLPGLGCTNIWMPSWGPGEEWVKGSHSPLSPSFTNNIHLGYVYIASCPRHDPSHPVHELTHYASVLEQLMHGVVSFATSSHRSWRRDAMRRWRRKPCTIYIIRRRRK